MSATQKLLRFGVFELNLDTEELRKSGTIIKLPPQSLKLLALLASQAGQQISREEIQKQLWWDTLVDFEQGINRCINQIRNVLGDNADHPLYIETVPRKGYRFVAPVTSKNVLAPRPQIVESDSGERDRPSARLAGSGGTSAALAEAVAPRHAPEPEVALAPSPAPVPKPRHRFRRQILVVTGAVIILGAAIGGGLYWRAHRTRLLTEKDTIVIADFDNKTDDPIFDGTLQQALSEQLQQSPFLNPLPYSRVSGTLALMEQPKNARVTQQLAREVCQRTGSAATIEGSISPLGSLYLLEVKALDCHDGVVLADEQATVKERERIVETLGKMATRLRTKLGESLASVQKYDAPAEQVTTASLEALHAYDLGYKAQVLENNYPSAVLLFEHAASLDSNFAMAYARLGTTYFNLGQDDQARENIRKAHTLKDRLSERERLLITFDYEAQVIGDLIATRKVLELWNLIYPGDDAPVNNLGAVYSQLGDYDAALRFMQESLRRNPRSGLSYGNLVRSYLTLNRLDEAKATIQDAQSHHINSPYFHTSLYLIAFLQQDPAGMERETAALIGHPEFEGDILYYQSETAAYYGHFVKARELTERVADSAQRAGEKEGASGVLAIEAIREALAGNQEFARKQGEIALGLSQSKGAAPLSAIALGLTGDSVRAMGVAETLSEQFPQDTAVQLYWVPAIRGAVALGKGSASTAVDALAPAMPYEFGSISSDADFILYHCYLRGLAYLAAHEGTAAAAEFQKIVDHPGAVKNEPIGALAHLGLGRAYALTGDTMKAKTAYDDFLNLWKDADPDIPIYKQAKAEYAKLQ